MAVYKDWAREPEGMRRALLGPEAETMRRWLAFLRIGAGLVYLYAFVSNLSGGFLATFPQTLQTLAIPNKLFVARRLLESYVIPHAQVFAWVVLGAELVVGALLLLGLGTRLVALFGVLMQVLYLLAALGTGILTTAANALFIVVLLVIFGTVGGWRWSLDEQIMNRR